VNSLVASSPSALVIFGLGVFLLISAVAMAILWRSADWEARQAGDRLAGRPLSRGEANYYLDVYERGSRRFIQSLLLLAAAVACFAWSLAGGTLRTFASYTTGSYLVLATAAFGHFLVRGAPENPNAWNARLDTEDETFGSLLAVCLFSWLLLGTQLVSLAWGDGPKVAAALLVSFSPTPIVFWMGLGLYWWRVNGGLRRGFKEARSDILWFSVAALAVAAIVYYLPVG
jgi:hypothetical protein